MLKATPSYIFVQTNGQLTLRCHANLSLKYCWFRDSNGSSFSSKMDELDFGKCSYDISQANASHSGLWTCSAGISNFGVVREIQAKITVDVAGEMKFLSGLLETMDYSTQTIANIRSTESSGVDRVVSNGGFGTNVGFSLPMLEASSGKICILRSRGRCLQERRQQIRKLGTIGGIFIGATAGSNGDGWVVDGPSGHKV
ncbi:hypothetical protein AAG570_013268 [Ranatra chinensis]|uniref:Ig-like domain-containing protein n=1 Tax=Ranatra chinensis TaxID=642074 RepID=A0ABD0YGG0_9HEMI